MVQFGGVFEGPLAGLADKRGVRLRGLSESVFATFAFVGLVDVLQEFLLGWEAVPAADKAAAERCSVF